jgi:alkylhydroperoxidase family enzyme
MPRTSRDELLARLKTSVLTGEGETDESLRRAVAQRADTFGGGPGPKPDLPLVVAGYVDKIATTPYKVLDEDIEHLKAAGYSEDAIFEITVSAALGSAMARIERGLAALREVS